MKRMLTMLGVVFVASAAHAAEELCPPIDSPNEPAVGSEAACQAKDAARFNEDGSLKQPPIPAFAPVDRPRG